MYSINKKLLKEKNKNSFSEDDKRRILYSFKHLNDDDKILVLLSQIIGNRFKASKKIVHETFFDLKEKFPRHFKNFYFSTNENYPFSKKLDDIFFRFQNYRALSMENPDYDKYLISDETKDTIKKVLLPKVEVEDKRFFNNLPKMAEFIKKRLE